MTRLLVATRGIPAYRVPFFDQLAKSLALYDTELVVMESSQAPSLAARHDMRSGPWAKRIPTLWLRLGDREIALRRLGRTLREVKPSLVIVEQSIRNLDTYPLLARHAAGSLGLAMWGHGRSYSTTQSAGLARFKQRLTQRCDWFFAYTDEGAEHVIQQGFSPSRVTVFYNTIDTEQLRADLGAVTSAAVEGFRRLHGLIPGKTALFLGGVDENKGMSFLLETARIAEKIQPEFTLLIAGDGQEIPKARAAEAAGARIRVLGRAEGYTKALALTAADVLAIPIRIGLVAVDGLAAGRPIVTTNHPLHNPENAYLVPGETSIVARFTPEDYANALVSTLAATNSLAAMQEACRTASYAYSMDAMVERVVGGVLAWADLRAAHGTGRSTSDRGASDLPMGQSQHPKAPLHRPEVDKANIHLFSAAIESTGHGLVTDS